MTTRRSFLTGAVAASLWPQPSWAEAGAPTFLSAARDRHGAFLLAGLDPQGQILFRHPLPGRGHAAAAHPLRPEAVAFARRPGRFADVIDCRDGGVRTRITPPDGHHFYGHGCFSADGTRLFTTENDFENARGIIGVWEASATGYRRIGHFASGGIGPHDMLLRKNSGKWQLVVANGGIETHPDSGRAKLNLPEMRPNLSLLTLDGAPLDRLELDPELRLNSIRHLALSKDGTIGFAMQWQGDGGTDLPITGLYHPGDPVRLLAVEDPRLRNLAGYGGSLTFSARGDTLAVSSPRGGVVQIMDCASGHLLREHFLADVCGLGTGQDGLVASTGQGRLMTLSDVGVHQLGQEDLAWDNHLVTLT